MDLKIARRTPFTYFAVLTIDKTLLHRGDMKCRNISYFSIFYIKPYICTERILLAINNNHMRNMGLEGPQSDFYDRVDWDNESWWSGVPGSQSTQPFTSIFCRWLWLGYLIFLETTKHLFIPLFCYQFLREQCNTTLQESKKAHHAYLKTTNFMKWIQDTWIHTII